MFTAHIFFSFLIGLLYSYGNRAYMIGIKYLLKAHNIDHGLANIQYLITLPLIFQQKIKGAKDFVMFHRPKVFSLYGGLHKK